MDNKNTHKLSMPLKVLTSASLLLSLSPVTNSNFDLQPKKASADLFTEAQHGCYKGSESDSEDSIDGKSSKKNGSKGDASAKIPNAEVLQDIYDYLHGEYGFSATFIAGISANWVKEAQLDPTANEPMQSGVESAKKATNGELGIGWGQWSFERHHMLVKHAEKMGKDWWEPEAQLDYMVTADGFYVDILRDLALNSGDDPVQEAVNFHNEWERSADSAETVMADRGQVAKDVLAYMKANGMDGEKDESKIKKIKQTSSASKKSSASNSSSSNIGEKVVDIICGGDDSKGGKTRKGSGKIGEDTKVNGKSGKVITQNYEYDDLPEKYKKEIDVPKFKPEYLDKPGNLFVPNGYKGQCTELTWAYMSQLWKKTQPQNGHGKSIWQAYKSEGAKITKKPTVGYGFSASAPQANAGSTVFGHTGVVVGVMDDGKWIMANFNVPPKPAPSRTLYYTVVDGTDGSIKFFSGIK